jgi:hypothetical protein
VESADPFQFTSAPDENPLPLAVRVKVWPPAVALDGLNEVIVGPALTVNVAPLDVTPPEVTVTVAVPAAAMRLAGTCAVN